MKATVKDSIIRTGSIWYNFARQQIDWHKHNQVISGLFLGVIPTATTYIGEHISNSADQIIEDILNANPTKPLGLVVSVVEPDELAGEGFSGVTMAQPKDWIERNIEHRLVEMRDFSAVVDIKTAIDAILKMKEVIDSGKAVYIHCKAGRSRSAMFCAIYLSLFMINPLTGMNYTLEEAEVLIRNARKQICIEDAKMILAAEIIEEIQKILNISAVPETKEEIALTHERLNQFLVDSHTKERVLQLSCTLNLEDYALRAEKLHRFTSCHRTELVNELTMLIKKPHSEQWFFAVLEHPNNPLLRFEQAEPARTDSPDDSMLRRRLAQAFVDEVLEFTTSALSCSREELMTLIHGQDRPHQSFSFEILSPASFRPDSP